jgi:O-antigen ligase
MAERLRGIAQVSLFCRFLMAVDLWLSRQWQNSVLVQAFLSPMAGEARVQSSLLYRLWQKFHSVLCTLFSALHLNQVLTGSLFRRQYLWCLLALALAPLVPTMAMLALAALAALAFLLNLGCDRAQKLVYTPANRYILLFAAIYLASTFLSVTVQGSLPGGLVTVFSVLWTLVLLNAVTTRRQLDILTAALVAAGVLVSVYGVAQYVLGVTGSSAWLDSNMFSSITTRVYSTLQNPNVLAEYLLLVIPFSAAGIFTGKTKLRRALYLCAFALLCLCMLLTFSRGGWLGLLFAGAVFLVLLDRRSIWLFFIALIALYFVLPDAVIARFTSIGNMTDGSTSYRVAIWLGTLSMLKDHWLCGVGPGTAAFNAVYPSYSYESIVAPHAHNLYLQLLCDCGIIGLLAFLAVVFLFFRFTCTALTRQTDRPQRLGLIASISGMCGFLVQSMTDYSFYNYRVMFLFWVYLTVGLLYARRTELKEGAAP